MRGPQTLNEQRMAKDIQNIDIKVNSIIAQRKKEEKVAKAVLAITVAGTILLFIYTGILFA